MSLKVSTMSNHHASSSSSSSSVETVGGNLNLPRLPRNTTHSDYIQFEPRARSFLSSKQVNNALIIDAPFGHDCSAAEGRQLYEQICKRIHDNDVGALSSKAIRDMLQQNNNNNNNNTTASANPTSSQAAATTTTTTTTTTQKDELDAARKYVSASRMAYGLIFSMLPEELQMIANKDSSVLHDYAYSLCVMK